MFTRKNVIRTISILLAFVLFTGLLPMDILGRKLNTALATSELFTMDEYVFEAPQASVTSVSAELPPTFIIDETCEVEEGLEAELSEIQMAATSSGDGEIEYPNKNLVAPNSYEYNSNERIVLNSGGLIWENIDYTLPGINGLDLKIGRRYGSDSASVYNPVGSYSSYSGTEPNSYLNSLYGLGQGWSFMFSFIEIVGSNKYLHLSDGNSYEINITSTAGDSNLKDYTLKDIRLEQESGGYSNGSVSSAYTLYYKDGRREYFSSDGKLIGIKDKYDNTIKFVNDTLNGYPRIIITDTLNRITTISAQGTTNNGHIMIVALPGSVTLKYTVERLTSPVSCDALAKYEDAMSIPTNFSYTIQSGGFNVYNKNTGGATNYFLNLTTITHPTSAQTVYGYETVSRNLGSSGLAINYRIKTRIDKIGTTSYNAKTYTYSSNNNTGYPAQSNPGSLPSTFTYYTTVTDSDGVSATATFDNIHQKTKIETKEGTIKISEKVYEYNTYKLPTKVTAKVYNRSNQSAVMQTITAAQYDAWGNLTAEWSVLADGVTANTEYKTTYTYDSTYNMPLSVEYKQNASKTVRVSYTLDSSKKHILYEQAYENNVLKSRTDYTYDAYGNLKTKKLYKDGFVNYNLIEYGYQDNAYLSQVKIAGILNADSTLAESTPGYAAGTIVTTFQYDTLGRLRQSTDGNGNVTRYEYNGKGDVTQITNPDNTTVTYTRNYTSNFVIVKDERGIQIKYTYTALGLEHETIDVQSNSVMTRKEYNGNSMLKKVTEYVYGGITEYSYDTRSRVTSETVKQGAAVLSNTTYDYTDAVENSLYQKVTKTVVGDSTAPSIVTTEYTDKNGNVVKTGQFMGNTEALDTYTYDYIGKVLTGRSAYAAERNLAFSTKYEYDYAGRAVKTYNAENNYMSAVYDALGNLTSATDYAGTPTNYSYDALGRLLTEIVTIALGVTKTTKYYYDAAGNVIRQLAPNNVVGNGATWAKTEYDYTSRGNLEYATMYNGAAVDSVTKYTYDGTGNLQAMRTGMSSKTTVDGVSTSYAYDRFGNTLTVTDPLGQAECYQYSTLGKLESKTDRNGNVTVYSFDALGRMLSTSVTADGKTEMVQFQYALTGAKKLETNGAIAQQYEYDSLGRTKKITETGNVVKEYGYNLAGNRTSFLLKVNGGMVENITYDYDNMNRLKTVSEEGLLKVTYSYDTNGNRKSLQYTNGNRTVYAYSEANWVTGIQNYSGSALVSSCQYRYYADGNQHQKTAYTGTETITYYNYDGAGRLNSENISDGDRIVYEYDRF